ncbi:MAG TPA: hypothetical protein VN800_01475 [Candidatus Acidoferrales bacterium]|nr:hypothetical protein [Candidatus Acidoferrales bacterium]
MAVVPGPGTGPLDPTLPLARIASGPVEGLGFCAPVPATGGPGGLARAGGLPGAPAVWAPGRYALQLLARGADPEDAWLVVEIVPAA